MRPPAKSMMTKRRGARTAITRPARMLTGRTAGWLAAAPSSAGIVWAEIVRVFLGVMVLVEGPPDAELLPRFLHPEVLRKSAEMSIANRYGIVGGG